MGADITSALHTEVCGKQIVHTQMVVPIASTIRTIRIDHSTGIIIKGLHTGHDGELFIAF